LCAELAQVDGIRNDGRGVNGSLRCSSFQM
jgi:hypothetical protein